MRHLILIASFNLKDSGSLYVFGLQSLHTKTISSMPVSGCSSRQYVFVPPHFSHLSDFMVRSPLRLEIPIIAAPGEPGAARLSHFADIGPIGARGFRYLNVNYPIVVYV